MGEVVVCPPSFSVVLGVRLIDFDRHGKQKDR